MGYKAIENIYKVTGIGATNKAVLLCLAWHVNDNTGDCFPSIETIAKETELGRRTVNRAITWLKDNGYIEVIRVGKKCNNRYKVMCQSVQSDVPMTTSDVPMTTSDVPQWHFHSNSKDNSKYNSNRTGETANIPVGEPEKEKDERLAAAPHDIMEYLQRTNPKNGARLWQENPMWFTGDIIRLNYRDYHTWLFTLCPDDWNDDDLWAELEGLDAWCANKGLRRNWFFTVSGILKKKKASQNSAG